MNKETKKPKYYVPEGAKINTKNEELGPPKTEYDDTMAVISREEIKKQITKRETP